MSGRTGLAAHDASDMHLGERYRIHVRYLAVNQTWLPVDSASPHINSIRSILSMSCTEIHAEYGVTQAKSRGGETMT